MYLERKKYIMRNIQLFVLFGIFLLAFFLRFYKLGDIPLGFYQDESAIGYNAYSIIKTGRDEYGKFFPLYFKSFGDYKLPVYIYADIIPIIVFGLNEFAVRFPSALFGFLTIIIFYFFVEKLTANKKLALLATLFLTINPWSLFYNRATYEVSISIFFFILGNLFLHLFFIERKKGTFLLGTFCFIISLYSYNLTRLLSPVLYTITFAYYVYQKKMALKKEMIVTGFITCIFLLPFFLTLLKPSGINSAKGTLFFSSSSVQAPLIELRSYFVNSQPIIGKLFFNSFSLNILQYIQNILAYFSVTFLFLSGDPHGNHGIGNTGQFFLYELPLIIFGVYVIVRNNIKWGYFLFLWAASIILVASLTRESPQATRSFFLVVPYEIFSAFGFYHVILKFKNIVDKRVRRIIIISALLLIIFNLGYYFGSYYFHFPILYAKSWRLTDKYLSLYLKDNQSKYNKIIFDSHAGFIYTSLLFYEQFPPITFQNTVIRYPDDSEGFSLPISFGKYEFKDIDWTKDYHRTHSLIITTEDRKPYNIPSLKSFYFPSRPVVIAVKQELQIFPVQDISYVLVETK
jgi:4-amino-4-deoxy-L-arabinose transferase-like glycosyltransferase